jgi:carboxyl-terminal processing protease
MKFFGKKKIAKLAVTVLLIAGAGSMLAANAGDFSDLSSVTPFGPRSLWLMKQTKSIIETYHVDSDIAEVTEEKLVHGALKGMVQAWNDPYTRFVDPQTLRDEEIDMKGEYGGLGMYLGQRDGMVLVISPIEDTPADRAGLKPQDQIVKVNDEVVIGWNIHDIVKRLRGKPGSEVTISVRREGEDKLLDYTLVREIIKLRSVRFEMLPEKTGYVRITQFKQDTARDVRTALKDLKKDGAKGVVLDLRNNGGGLLNSAVEVADLFLGEGLVVSMKGRVERANDRLYSNSETCWDLPMTVLINEGSASASEIVAGALKDRDRATVVGMKSFGKGSVQSLFNLPDGSGVYVTIARYHTPAGTVIDHVGLEPHVEVEGEITKDHDEDRQLQRAVEELKKIMKSEIVGPEDYPRAG